MTVRVLGPDGRVEELPDGALPSGEGGAVARWKVRRSTLVERMTDDELAALETLIAALPLRDRELWRAVSYVWSDDARVLGVAATLGWSEERVAELLAVDPGAELLPD
ncbi:hypothetical protein [Elioraea thermophila]|uniref:hypothetical protein n=1 Tax=Elioraea thermophila TaxID=2185104 RepID=UPI001300A10C|nr:hypothetical protein [Elioraea thermophila]